MKDDLMDEAFMAFSSNSSEDWTTELEFKVSTPSHEMPAGVPVTANAATPVIGQMSTNTLLNKVLGR